MTSGADSFVAVEAFGHAQIHWLRRVMPLAGGVPSHDTLSRVFALVDRTHFEHSFAAWAAEAFEKTDGQIVAVDGKRLRRAHDAGDSVVSVVSAWATESDVALGQVTTEHGEGEITAIPRLLALLDLSGCRAGPRPGPSPSTRPAARPASPSRSGTRAATTSCASRATSSTSATTASGGSRTPWPAARPTRSRRPSEATAATSSYWSVAVPDEALRPTLWAGLTSVGMVEARRHVGGKTSVEQRGFATSLPVGAETLARAVRGHWGIENGLHWTLDVAFREDESRTREAHAAANLSVVRRVSATLLKAEPSEEGGVQTRRMRAAWDGAYRGRVLGLE